MKKTFCAIWKKGLPDLGLRWFTFAVIPARPAFLVTSILSVLAGIVVAMDAHHDVAWGYLPWVLIGACTAHLSINALNDYEDCCSGLDLLTHKTPFSGGSGVLVAYPEKAKRALWFSFLNLGITMAIGLYLIDERGFGVFLFGLLGVALILSYTRWLTRHPLLCFVAPGLGCGVLIVLGTELVLTGAISWPGLFTAAIFFCLYNNMLLLNQFPDIDADAQAGRRHYPIAIGQEKSLLLYFFSGSLASFLVLMACGLGFFPVMVLATFPFSLGFVGVFFDLSRNLDSWTALLGALRWNVIYILSTASCTVMTLFVAQLNG